MRLRKTLANTLIVGGFSFLLMALPAHWRYSTIGLDSDRLENELIIHRYFRLRWPGDGTFRVGGGEIEYTLEEEDVDPIDLAGRLLEQPQLDRHRSANWGFGYWSGPEVYDSREGKHLWARWISTPAWLPAAVLFAAGVWLRRPGSDRSDVKQEANS